MAKRVTEHLVDDIDGSEAAETIRFAVDGTEYEIDLSERNASEFHDAFAPTSRLLDASEDGLRARPDAARVAAASRRRSIPSRFASGPRARGSTLIRVVASRRR